VHAVPSTDVIAAEHAGHTIVYATAEGGIGALDPATGVVLGTIKVGRHLRGAAFAADAFQPGAPAGAEAGLTLAQSLGRIIRESRTEAVQIFAARELARSRAPNGIAILASIINDALTAPAVAEAAGAALLQHVDASPAGVAPIIQALGSHADRLARSHPRGIGILARIAGAARAREAVVPLLDQLEDPATPLQTIAEVAAALAKIGDASAAPRLTSFVLLHRADPDAAPAAIAALGALATVGGGPARETIAFIADDPRTTAAVAERAREKLIH